MKSQAEKNTRVTNMLDEDNITSHQQMTLY